MDYRIERVEGHSRTVYILYTMQMAYLATMSWHRGHLVYESHHPDLADKSAKDFEPYALKLAKGEQS